MKIGFIGCGKMAKKMADVLKNMNNFELYACSASNFERANLFKNEFGFKKAYGSYEELVKDNEVEVVYISVVAKLHFETMILAIKNNKNVVCEKPFTINSKESREAIDLARKNKVFLAEAIWTRFMPLNKTVMEELKNNVIGEPYLYLSNIGYKIFDLERMQDPLGGGVLLDCGVYPINFVRMFSKKDMKIVDVNTQLSNSGVDNLDILKFSLGENERAITINSMLSNMDLVSYIYGTNGYIKFDNVNNPRKVEIYSNDRPPKLIKTFEADNNLTGYEYQWIEFYDCIKKSMIESLSMPLDETQYIMELLDLIRSKGGIKFQNER